MVSRATLHYVHDPLCGWCYAVAPLVAAAREMLDVRWHGGGMMAGAQRQAVTPQLREFVMTHDRRIAQASGQPFGAAYFDGLLRDPQAVLDSGPPITAMLAADALGGRALDLLARLQQAHYVEGRRIADPAVLAQQAGAIGLDVAAFAAAYAHAAGAPTQAHIAASRALLGRLGGSGFPTFALERPERPDWFERVDAAAFTGQPQRWREWLRRELDVPRDAAPIAAEAPACRIDGC